MYLNVHIPKPILSFKLFIFIVHLIVSNYPIYYKSKHYFIF